MVVAALLALTWQSFVVQTHVDLPSGITAQVGTHQVRLGIHLPGGGAPDKKPLDCPLCRQAAQAGHYLSPALPPLAAPMATFAWRPVSLLVSGSPAKRRRAWHSRDPPAVS